MKLRTMIGTTERHQIEAETDWFGKRKLMVDGDDIIEKRELLSFTDTMRLTVGEEERHALRVKFSRGISGHEIEIYADGRLVACSRKNLVLPVLGKASSLGENSLKSLQPFTKPPLSWDAWSTGLGVLWLAG